MRNTKYGRIKSRFNLLAIIVFLTSQSVTDPSQRVMDPSQSVADPSQSVADPHLMLRTGLPRFGSVRFRFGRFRFGPVPVRSGSGSIPVPIRVVSIEN